MRTVGTCSICGGPVTVQESVGGCLLPAECQQCGATASNPFGPIIQMEPPLPTHVREELTRQLETKSDTDD